MDSGTDISVLYREFTDALTEVLAENAVGRRAVVGSRGHAPPSKGTLSTANMNIFWLWKPPSHSGRPCKTSVASRLKARGEIADALRRVDLG